MGGHSPRHYVKIWAILCVLLVLSIAGPELGIPVVTLLTAFGIAFVKAYLVCKHFMHLDTERPVVRYMLVTSLMFMLLFFAAVSPDVLNHNGMRWENLAAKQSVISGLAMGDHGGGHHGEGEHADEHADGEYPSAAEGHADDQGGHGEEHHGEGSEDH
jgi:caa(3)-type oxidase subunit IV